MSLRRKQFLTHDNGSRAFKVVIASDKSVSIFKIPKNLQTDDIYEMKDKEVKKLYIEKLLEFKNVQKVFVGKHPGNDLKPAFADGNSILLHLKGHEYVFIGDRIYSFQSKEPILNYYSEVGNNDVPYPTAVTENNVFLMIEYVCLPKSVFPPNIDFSVEAYQYYYGHVGDCKYTGRIMNSARNMTCQKKNQQKFKEAETRMHEKVLVKRQW